MRAVPLVCAVSLVCLVGCGPRFAPVSGTVTMAGKPLPGANVCFNPVSTEKPTGPGSIGTTDEEGKYTLQLAVGEGTGALVGPHKVIITAYEGGTAIPSSGSDMKFRKQLVAPEYNTASKLTFDVPAGGTREANFEVAPVK